MRLRDDFFASMELDWTTIASAAKEDVELIRMYLPELLLGALIVTGVNYGFPLLLPFLGPAAPFVVFLWVAFLTAGILTPAGMKLKRWFSLVLSADGDPAKIHEARKACAGFVEWLLVAGVISKFKRWLPQNADQGRAPIILNPREPMVPALAGSRGGKNVMVPATSGQGWAAAVSEPDPDLFFPDGRPKVSAPSGGSQRLDSASGAGPEDFFRATLKSRESIKGLEARWKQLSPTDRFEAYKQVVLSELKAYHLPAPKKFIQGLSDGFIPQEWSVQFSHRSVQDEFTSFSDYSGRIAATVNDILQYWTVLLHAARSPTLSALAFPYFPEDIASVALANAHVIPLPIKDHIRVQSLFTLLISEFELNKVEVALTRLRETPGSAAQIKAEQTAKMLKALIGAHSPYNGSEKAAKWARDQYDGAAETAAPEVAPQPQFSSLNSTQFDLDDAVASQLRILQADWLGLSEEQRCIRLSEVLNSRLRKYGVPPVKFAIAKGAASGFDPKEWVIWLRFPTLEPQMVRSWGSMFNQIAYEGEKARQHTDIVRYLLKVDPHATIAYKDEIVRVIRKLPELSREQREQAKAMLNSMRSIESMVAQTQWDVANAELETATRAQIEASAEYDASLSEQAADRLQRANQACVEAIVRYQAALKGYRQRPEERAAQDAGTRSRTWLR